jgi:HlyD family secretion protein
MLNQPLHNQPLYTRVIIPLGILSIAILIAVTLVISKPSATVSESKEKSWMVAVMPAKLQALSPQISIYGKVESPYVTKLTAAINADVKTVTSKEGQSVSKGQVLVQLHGDDYLLQLKQRKAEASEIDAQINSELDRHDSNLQALEHEKSLLNLASKRMERAQSLKRENLSTQSLIDEAEQVVVTQQLVVNARMLAIKDHDARLAQLKARAIKADALRGIAALNVKRSKIVAPFSGKITQVNVSPGDRVKVGDPIIELYDHTTLEIRAQIPTQHESTIHRALSENTPLIGTALLNQQTIPVTLDRVSGKISQGSGGLDGLFRVDTLNEHLQLGRTLELKLSLPIIENLVALPREAIYGSNRIYLLVDNRLSALLVERIGEIQYEKNINFVLIKSADLKPGDSIVTTQLPNAIDGLLVKVAINSQ